MVNELKKVEEMIEELKAARNTDEKIIPTKRGFTYRKHISVRSLA